MPIIVGEEKYEDAEACLSALMRMIRVGLPSEMSLGQANDAEVATVLEKHKRQMADTISALKKEMVTRRGLGETNRLRLVTLEAEFHQQQGDHAESIRILEPEWKRLKPRLDMRTTGKPFHTDGNHELLRQEIWALLHYVFYYYYRSGGQHDVALEHFLSIEKLINSELKTSDRPSYGTLALCNYFIGLCYRVQRGFRKADRRLLTAQQFTHERLEKELRRTDTDPERKKYEIAYKDVFSARILFSLGWVAFQQGQLVRAQQHLRTAQNLLIQDKHWLRILIDTLFWMAVRRRASYDDPDYDKSLQKLAKKWDETNQFHELNKQRLAFELVRGYLDLAEFNSSDDADRTHNLALAQQWLLKTGKLSNQKARQRYDLHLTRLLLVKGEIAAADKQLADVENAVPENELPQRAIRIMRACIAIVQKRFDVATSQLNKTLAEILPLAGSDSRSGYRIPDPVLESECYVRLAQIRSADGDFPGARQYLRQWSLLSQFVENNYLHHIADAVAEKGMPFALEAEYNIFNAAGEAIEMIPDRLDDFERWLITNAGTRGYSRKDLDRMYDLDPSAVTRRKQRLFPERG